MLLDKPSADNLCTPWDVTFQCEEINFRRYYLVVSKLVLGSVGSPEQPSKAETISGLDGWVAGVGGR